MSFTYVLDEVLDILEKLKNDEDIEEDDIENIIVGIINLKSEMSKSDLKIFDPDDYTLRSDCAKGTCNCILPFNKPTFTGGGPKGAA